MAEARADDFEAALRKVVRRIDHFENAERECRRVADENPQHPEQFEYTEGLAAAYHDCAFQLRQDLGVLVLRLK